jgi:hypothetical protein
MNKKALANYGNLAGLASIVILVALWFGWVQGPKWNRAKDVLGGASVVLFLVSKA